MLFLYGLNKRILNKKIWFTKSFINGPSFDLVGNTKQNHCGWPRQLVVGAPQAQEGCRDKSLSRRMNFLSKRIEINLRVINACFLKAWRSFWVNPRQLFSINHRPWQLTLRGSPPAGVISHSRRRAASFRDEIKGTCGVFLAI
jgi:hypothetical protein